MKLKMLDCFAGVGCMSLAAHKLGIETSAFIEWNEDCQEILRMRFPNIKIHGDIRDVDGNEYRGSIDIVAGGFPCQPYSLAGKRKGASDDVDQWPELLRIISEVRPTWAICENVAGILSMEYDRFIADLENIGYQAITLDLSADAFGVPTLERHIWIIATPNEIGRERVREKKVQNEQILQREFSGSYKGDGDRRDIPKSRFCRVRERVADRLDKSSKNRLEMVGNAFPPQMAEFVLKPIIQLYN